MSASHSLIALVNQLQAMESALASIMFESVAKLSSLTSSSVFLLIETDEGNRRFSGAQHLKDAFLDGALAASPKDMQVMESCMSPTLVFINTPFLWAVTICG